MKAYDALTAVLRAVETNHARLRAEPDSDGNTHDKWEAEEDVLCDLEETLEEAVDKYEEAMEIRKSLRTAILK